MHALPYTSPLAYAAALERGGGDFVLLHSSLAGRGTGERSLLACGAVATLRGDTLEPLRAALGPARADTTGWEQAWFGWLGYELGAAVPAAPDPWLGTPPALNLTRFAAVACFDHAQRTLTVHGAADALPPPCAHWRGGTPRAPQVQMQGGDMDRAGYLQRAHTVLEAIRAGRLYQANLTRKEWGELRATDDDPAAMTGLFMRLCTFSPAPYSALIRAAPWWVVSSSPEQYVQCSPQGVVSTRPIKGSVGRSADPVQDAARRAALASSAKDRAENLMIVDLMRHDLSQVCRVGSVQVPELFTLDSYATIHHLSSLVQGQLREGCTAVDAAAACFPPGSMTGAPKRAAMHLLRQLEPYARGIYSGALGWFGADGACDLSVVIRTLVARTPDTATDPLRFCYQVGGGIVADSDPTQEWLETEAKARGLRAALGLDALK